MLRKALLFVPALFAVVAFSSDAFAIKKVYSLNAGLNQPVFDDGSDYEGGLNIEGVVQVPIPFPLFDLELEGKLGANTFTRKGAGDNALLTRAAIGLRGGVNFAAYPYGYVNVGFGNLSGPWAHAKEGIWAPVGEIGIGLDITAIPYIRIGLYGAYNHVMLPEDGAYTSSTDRDFQWLSYGLKIGYVDDGND